MKTNTYIIREPGSKDREVTIPVGLSALADLLSTYKEGTAARLANKVYVQDKSNPIIIKEYNVKEMHIPGVSRK